MLRLARKLKNSPSDLRFSGTRADPASMASVAANAQRLAAEHDLALGQRVDAEQRAGNLGSTPAEHAAETQDLAFAQIKADVAHAVLVLRPRASNTTFGGVVLFSDSAR